MPTRNVSLTETPGSIRRGGNRRRALPEVREREESAKLEWLRNAASKGFDQLDRSEGIEFRSAASLDRTLEKLKTG